MPPRFLGLVCVICVKLPYNRKVGGRYGLALCLALDCIIISEKINLAYSQTSITGKLDANRAKEPRPVRFL